MKNKKTITPHKGGRTTRLYIRITPEDKRKLERIAQNQNKSIADIIHEWIEKSP